MTAEAKRQAIYRSMDRAKASPDDAKVEGARNAEITEDDELSEMIAIAESAAQAALEKGR